MVFTFLNIDYHMFNFQISHLVYYKPPCMIINHQTCVHACTSICIINTTKLVGKVLVAVYMLSVFALIDQDHSHQ